jgi:hypothetical protein
MKISLVPDRSKPLDRAKAINCAVINQLATPGLGTWIGGRTLVAVGQLALAIAGFLMICGWFLSVLWQSVQNIPSDAATPLHFPWLGKAGAVLFAVAWVWSGFTSVSLLREARRNEREGRPAPPEPPPVIKPD